MKILRSHEFAPNSRHFTLNSLIVPVSTKRQLQGRPDGCSTPATAFTLIHNLLSRGDRSERNYRIRYDLNEVKSFDIGMLCLVPFIKA